MKRILIKFRYEQIEAVSDRTAREALKSLSKLCRQAQMREVDEILRHTRLTRREKQSLKDRLRQNFEAAPVYYLKHAKKGSLEIVALLGAALIWGLQNTLGETVKEAWKQTAVHKNIIDWVKNKRSDEATKLIKDETNRHEFLSGRMRVHSISEDENKSQKIIEVVLRPDEYTEVHEPREIDEKLIVRNGRDKIRDLDT